MDHKGFRKRWPANTNQGAQLDDEVGSPSTAPAGSDIFGGSVDFGDVHCETSFASVQNGSSSSASSSFQHVQQSYVQQTGFFNCTCILAIFKASEAAVGDRTALKRFDLKPSNFGLSDVLSPQPKVQAVIHKPIDLQAPGHIVRKRIAMTSYNIQDNELRSRALNRFRVLVSLDLNDTQIGKSMLYCLGALGTNTDVMRVLSDALANKATGTLMKRSSSLWRWATWVAESGNGTCFRQAEDAVYRYLNHLRSTGAAPTVASHFLEALRFSDQSFKLSRMNLDSILSARIKGAEQLRACSCRRGSCSRPRLSQWRLLGSLRACAMAM